MVGFLRLHFSTEHLLEDPLRLVVGVLDDTLGEPAAVINVSGGSEIGAFIDLQRDLLVGALDGVRAVADVAANGKGEVATDSAYEVPRVFVRVKNACDR